MHNEEISTNGRAILFSLTKKPSGNGRQRGGVLLIPGLDATFAGKGRPDWMAVTKDAVWVASSSVNHVVRLDAKTNQPGTIVTVAKPCAGLRQPLDSEFWRPHGRPR